MTLKELKDFFESQEENKKFKFSISKPFSWRGSYDEVAFSIEEEESTREEILENIYKAYHERFEGHKGGMYEYTQHTTVNFEEYSSDWSDGSYALNILLKSLFN